MKGNICSEAFILFSLAYTIESCESKGGECHWGRTPLRHGVRPCACLVDLHKAMTISVNSVSKCHGGYMLLHSFVVECRVWPNTSGLPLFFFIWLLARVSWPLHSTLWARDLAREWCNDHRNGPWRKKRFLTPVLDRCNVFVTLIAKIEREFI